MLALRLALVIALMGARALSDLVPGLLAIGVAGVRRNVVERIEALLPVRFRADREGLSETGTIATLRFLISAQEEFRAAAHIDDDRDGRGEFGGLAELMGRTSERGRRATSPILKSRSIDGGRMMRLGYYYRLYLPRRGGGLIAERHGGGFAKGEVDPERAETTWYVYAWPIEEQYAGSRTFFASSDGDIVATGWQEGRGGYAAGYEPPPRAAETRDGRVAAGATGRDGRFWRQTG
jgi:hypothetical protein